MGGQSRDGQHEMARQVARAIDTGDHLLVQAGTGTGKSLAYLIPLIAHSLVSDKPTLVPTATLALQTQIVGRDLPRLLKTITPALERPVKIALVKGRSNYVCRHKLEGGFPSEEPSEGQLFSLGEDTSVPHFAAAMGGPSSQLEKEVVRLREWAEETATGDRDEHMPGVTDRAWRQVSVTSMECLGAQKCPSRPNASANWPGRTPRTPTSSSPTTQCWPSVPSRASRSCPSTTSWWWTKPTSCRTA